MRASQAAQWVKNSPTMRETQAQSLGGEDPLERGMETHSSILAWGIPWTEQPGGYSPWGCKESDRTEATEQAYVLFISIHHSYWIRQEIGRHTHMCACTHVCIYVYTQEHYATLGNKECSGLDEELLVRRRMRLDWSMKPQHQPHAKEDCCRGSKLEC